MHYSSLEDSKYLKILKWIQINDADDVTVLRTSMVLISSICYDRLTSSIRVCVWERERAAMIFRLDSESKLKKKKTKSKISKTSRMIVEHTRTRFENRQRIALIGFFFTVFRVNLSLTLWIRLDLFVFFQTNLLHSIRSVKRNRLELMNW